MYTEFAQLYDELMRDVDYEGWAEFYANLMHLYGINGGNVCECACGTGSLTLPLKRLGFHMTGIDLSQDMLWIAAQKARKEGLAIPFVRQDMRSLRLHRPMDAILATCDGVNYLLSSKELCAFFKAAYASLRPGGGLFFDVSTPYKLSQVLGNHMICEDTDHVTYVWQNSYHEHTGQVDMHLCFFVREEDGRYRRIDEDQTQASHSMQDLSGALALCGFEQIRFFGNGKMGQPAQDEERWHIAARKSIRSENES